MGFNESLWNSVIPQPKISIVTKRATFYLALWYFHPMKYLYWQDIYWYYEEEFPRQRLNGFTAIALLDGISGIFTTPDIMIIAPRIGYLWYTCRSDAAPHRWNGYTAINMVNGIMEKNYLHTRYGCSTACSDISIHRAVVRWTHSFTYS
jgi:hypothetical protein